MVLRNWNRRKKYLRGIGDKLSKNEFEILSENTLFGNDVDLKDDQIINDELIFKKFE